MGVFIILARVYSTPLLLGIPFSVSCDKPVWIWTQTPDQALLNMTFKFNTTTFSFTILCNASLYMQDEKSEEFFCINGSWSPDPTTFRCTSGEISLMN